MKQVPIKKQWRVLLPDGEMSEECAKSATQWGFNAIAQYKFTGNLPLDTITRVDAPSYSPFHESYEQWIDSIAKNERLLYRSALFELDLRKELLKRALLPVELHLLEIKLLQEKMAGRAIFYLLPDKNPETYGFSGRHFEILLNGVGKNTFLLFSSTVGEPCRLDLPAHPLLSHPSEQIIPVLDAQPMKPIEGEWPYLHAYEERNSFFVKTPSSFIQGSVLQRQLEHLIFRGPVELKLDKRFCFLQALAQGREGMPQEEFRLFGEMLIAEMRFEEKRGENLGHAQKKALLIKAYEKLNVPVPIHLKLTHDT